MHKRHERSLPDPEDERTAAQPHGKLDSHRRPPYAFHGDQQIDRVVLPRRIIYTIFIYLLGISSHGIAWPPAKTIYALRACIALAAAGPGVRMKTAEIAQVAAAPKGFLSKILGELRAADIVSAQRGYRGGYRLTRPPDDIRLDELLNAVGTRDPFASLSHAVEASLPFIDDLRSRLQALAAEVLHGASLAELSTNVISKYDLTGQDSNLC